MESIYDLTNIKNLQWLRRKRNSLLRRTDFSQLSDVPLTSEKKLEWATYRQQLRDLTVGLPTDLSDYSHVVFPTPPSE